PRSRLERAELRRDSLGLQISSRAENRTLRLRVRASFERAFVRSGLPWKQAAVLRASALARPERVAILQALLPPRPHESRCLLSHLRRLLREECQTVARNSRGIFDAATPEKENKAELR